MLQGSLDNFSLDEVLGLLAGTSKTGRLRVSGDRGTGSLWLDQGQLISGSTAPGTTLELGDAVFELMRFRTGNFSFNMDEAPDVASDPVAVAQVVSDAGERLEEWRSIEAVVPSLDHIVTLKAELPVPTMTISQDEWRVVIATGERAAVRELCAALDLGEVDGSRVLKGMIERQLLAIQEDARTPTRSAAAIELEPIVDPVGAGSVADDSAVIASPRSEAVIIDGVPFQIDSTEAYPAPDEPVEMPSFGSVLQAGVVAEPIFDAEAAGITDEVPVSVQASVPPPVRPGTPHQARRSGDQLAPPPPPRPMELTADDPQLGHGVPPMPAPPIADLAFDFASLASPDFSPDFETPFTDPSDTVEMPPAPSPADVVRFDSAPVPEPLGTDAEPVDSGIDYGGLLDEGDDDDGSLLMRYLKSER